MRITLAVLCLALSATAWAADTFTLVADGKPAAQIVTRERAPESVQFAARELRAYQGQGIY